MRKVLYILGKLCDQDMDWIARNGRLETAEPGQVLIEQGVHCDDMIIVMDGQLQVSVNGIGAVAELGAGELVGEMSFVDSAAPSATVAVSRSSRVLLLDKSDMRAELDRNKGFSARFYNALALFLADRLRTMQSQRALGEGGSLKDDAPLEDELDIEMLECVSQAGASFNRLAQRVLN